MDSLDAFLNPELYREEKKYRIKVLDEGIEIIKTKKDGTLLERPIYKYAIKGVLDNGKEIKFSWRIGDGIPETDKKVCSEILTAFKKLGFNLQISQKALVGKKFEFLVKPQMTTQKIITPTGEVKYEKVESKFNYFVPMKIIDEKDENTPTVTVQNTPTVSVQVTTQPIQGNIKVPTPQPTSTNKMDEIINVIRSQLPIEKESLTNLLKKKYSDSDIREAYMAIIMDKNYKIIYNASKSTFEAE